MKRILTAVFLLFTLNAFAAVELNGAGATFPYPLYSKWFNDYTKENPEVKLNYSPIGSGGGIRQIIAGTVDFGASDVPMNDEEKKQTKTEILHIPTTVGAVAAVYTLKGVTANLKLDGQTLADIFTGTVKKWNDSAIAKLNPGITLPDKDILVVHRADASGTTAVFTEYLARVSAQWKSSLGFGKSVNWPVGVGGKGNDGVTSTVGQIEGAIGYVELAYAINNKLQTFALKNRSGNFVLPTTESVSKAAAVKKGTKVDLTASILDKEGKDSYPISSLTWVLIPVTKDKNEKRTEFVKFLRWALTKGQTQCEKLNYAPLPKELAKAALAKINGL